MPFGSKMALIIHDNRKYVKRTFYCMMNTGFGAGIMIPAFLHGKSTFKGKNHILFCIGKTIRH